MKIRNIIIGFVSLTLLSSAVVFANMSKTMIWDEDTDYYHATNLKVLESLHIEDKKIMVDEDSGMLTVKEEEEGVWQPTSFKVATESLWVGLNVAISAVGHFLGSYSPSEEYHLYPYSEFNEELSIRDAVIPNSYDYIERVEYQSDNSGTWTGTTQEFTLVSPAHLLLNDGYFQTDTIAATESIRYKIWKGTDDTGTLIFDQTYPASKFPASTEVQIIARGYIEFEEGYTYFHRFVSDANFSLKTDVTGSAPWIAADTSFIREDNLLQTAPYVDGDTYTEGQYLIDSRKIYVANTTGVQTGTFASNSGLWDKIGTYSSINYWTKNVNDLEYDAGNVTVKNGSINAYGAGGVNDNFVGGKEAGAALTSGMFNTLVGWSAGNDITTENLNTFIGTDAGNNATTVSSATAVGAFALANATDADNTVAIGWESGAFASGKDSVYLGYKAGYNNDVDSKLFIGNILGTLIEGDFANSWVKIHDDLYVVSDVGIGTTDMSTELGDAVLKVKSSGYSINAIAVESSIGTDLLWIRESADGDGSLHMRDKTDTQTIQITTDEADSYILNGNFGIGTDSPLDELTVNGSIGIRPLIGSANLRFWGGDTTNYTLYADAGGNFIVRDSTAAANRLIVDSSGLEIVNGILEIDSGYPIIWGDASTSINGSSVTDAEYIKLQTAGVVRLTVDGDGNVGIGLTGPTAHLDITGDNLVGNDSLRLRSGDNTRPADSNQILFSYNGGTNYTHAIKTRHSSGTGAGNSIDFYTWNYGVDLAGDVGTKHVMTLEDGNVGIGKTTPASKLHVLDNSTTSGADVGATIENEGVGDALLHFKTEANEFTIGVDRTDFNKFKLSGGSTNLHDDTYITIVTEDQGQETAGNVGIGEWIPTEKLVVGGGNLLISAGIINAYGQAGVNTNFVAGLGAGAAMTTTANTVLIGDGAGAALTTGSGNIFIGTDAGLSMEVASGNIAIGYEAGANALIPQTGLGNVYIGMYAGGDGSDDVNDVIAIGYYAGYDHVGSNSDSVFIGKSAGYKMTNGADTVAIGHDAGNLSTGSGSVYIGQNAGEQSSGSNSVYIGKDAGMGASYSTNDKLWIKELIEGDFANQWFKIHGAQIYSKVTRASGGNFIDVTGLSILSMDTQTADREIGGLTGGIEGQRLTIIKPHESFNLIIEDRGGWGWQDIHTTDGNWLVINNRGGVDLIFDGTNWLVLGTKTHTINTATSTDALDVTGLKQIALDTSSVSITIGGLINGTDGQRITLFKPDGANTLIIEHQETSGTEMIVTPNGSDIVINPGRFGGVDMIYHGGEWFVIDY